MSIAFLYYFYTQNDELISRINAMISENDSSGRDVIWSLIISEWSNKSNIFNLLFGYGYGGAIILTGSLFAHNDWLELLSSLGIYGVLLYFILVVSGFHFWTRLNVRHIFWWIWGSILFSWLFISMVSQYYPTFQFGTITIVMAYILANRNFN